MAIPRREIVDETQSGFYHVMTRTVRQGFLLLFRADGSVDDHRRDWIIQQLILLSTAYAIDCFAVAVMGNHVHLLLRIMPELVERWSDAEVIYRWLLVHRPKKLRKRLKIPLDAPPTRRELLRFLANPRVVEDIRKRLSSISWYMRELKLEIAVRANDEDGCKGAFWGERFKSVRVLDEASLMAVSAYIDLNPCRAGVDDDPLRSRFTSIEARLAWLESEQRRLIESYARGEVRHGDGWTSGVHSRQGAGPCADSASSPNSDCTVSTSPTDEHRGLEFWRRIAAAPDADGNVDPEEELETFIRRFDTAMFSAAIPARLEAYGVGDRWVKELEAEAGATKEGEGRFAHQEHMQVFPQGTAKDSDGIPLAPPHPDPPPADHSPREGPEVGTLDESECDSDPRAEPRALPAAHPLFITMGDYYRRLRALADLERNEGRDGQQGRSGAPPGSRRGASRGLGSGRSRDPISAISFAPPSGWGRTWDNAHGAAGGPSHPSSPAHPPIEPVSGGEVEAALDPGPDAPRSRDLEALTEIAKALSGVPDDDALRILVAFLAAPLPSGTVIGGAASVEREARRRGRRNILALNRPVPVDDRLERGGQRSIDEKLTAAAPGHLSDPARHSRPDPR